MNITITITEEEAAIIKKAVKDDSDNMSCFPDAYYVLLKEGEDCFEDLSVEEAHKRADEYIKNNHDILLNKIEAEINKK